MATTEELQTRLSEAENALHNVIVGKQTVRLEYDGKAVTYNQANVADLRAHINDLKSQLGLKCGRSRPVTVGF